MDDVAFTLRFLMSFIHAHVCCYSPVRAECLLGIRRFSTGVGGALRKRRTLYSIKAALKPNIAVTDRQVEEEKKRWEGMSDMYQ